MVQPFVATNFSDKFCDEQDDRSLRLKIFQQSLGIWDESEK